MNQEKGNKDNKDFRDQDLRVLNVLFEGWINIPHSYAIVLCNQLIGLSNKYPKGINIYVLEKEYFFQKWNTLGINYRSFYPKNYCEILDKIMKNSESLEGVKFDLIYRITYPYNVGNSKIPTCIFYTSEFSKLAMHYFTGMPYPLGPEDAERPSSVNDIKTLGKYLGKSKNLYFTGPSVWSVNGLKELGIPDIRNKVITHGVDTKLFYRNISERKEYRDKYSFTDSDIVLLNMGAFTSNKGILILLQLINILVNRLTDPQEKKSKFRMVFKGLSDLYESEKMLDIYFNALGSYITKEESKKLIDEKYIIFTCETMTCDELRKMYNMCDLYVSPYIAEGFNITPLEALACGCRVMVPRTGSTKEYIEDINNNVPGFIHYIDSKVIEHIDENGNNILINDISFDSLFNGICRFSGNVIINGDYQKLQKFLEENYSWERVADLLMNYFREIINGC
jgi:glycosyltransferase involved in cell wall biosynthesis